MKFLFRISFLSVVMIAITSSSAQAHNHFLTLVIDEPGKNIEKVIYYPEGTTYRIYQTRKIEETIKTDDVIIYYGDMLLKVYPTYKHKNDQDQLALHGKRLRIFDDPVSAIKAGFGGDWVDGIKVTTEVHDEDAIQTPYEELKQQRSTEEAWGVTLEKELIPSKSLKGKYNLKLSLSNGITFEYNDEKYAAKFNGEYVHTEGKYIIKTEAGTLKFSFNPANGVVYWFFEE